MPLITKKGGIQRFKKAKLHSFAEPPSVSSRVAEVARAALAEKFGLGRKF